MRNRRVSYESAGKDRTSQSERDHRITSLSHVAPLTLAWQPTKEVHDEREMKGREYPVYCVGIHTCMYVSKDKYSYVYKQSQSFCASMHFYVSARINIHSSIVNISKILFYLLKENPVFFSLSVITPDYVDNRNLLFCTC